jgi:hypothetical protein
MALSVFPWKNKGEPEPTALDRQNLNAAEEALAAQVTSGAIPLPSSVDTGLTKSHGEVEGEISPSLTEGTTYVENHTYVAKGAVTLVPPTGARPETSVVLAKVTQNAAGGHAIAVSNAFTVLNGPLPATNTGPNEQNTYVLLTMDGGAHWAILCSPRGEKGETGSEGFNPLVLLRLSAVKTYTTPEAGTNEERAEVANNDAASPRAAAITALAVPSGTPVLAAIPTSPKTKINAVVFAVDALETEPTKRTHLWVAVLNAKYELLGHSADFTSATNVPLKANTPCALKLESQIESGSAPELLYAVLCEVVTSGTCISLYSREIQNNLQIQSPRTAALGNTGQTIPSSLPSPVTPAALEVGGKFLLPRMGFA